MRLYYNKQKKLIIHGHSTNIEYKIQYIFIFFIDLIHYAFLI
jgi:hypothetical protein